MPYADGNPTLGEQLEEDARRQFYTKDLLNDARDLMRENRQLRAMVQTLIDNEPDDMAADGVTVFDVWRKDAKALLAAID